MKKIFLILLFITLGNEFLYSQNSDSYVIISIDKKTSEGFHKEQFDSWIIKINEWKEIDKKAIYPFMINGYTRTDYNECCKENELVFFNYTKNEKVKLDAESLSSRDNLEKIIRDKKRRVQVIRKKWKSGKKQKIMVYLTPVKGDFCFCSLKHSNPNVELGYKGQIALPKSNFYYNNEFWDQEISKGIIKYDYTDLPFLSLQTIQ